ncbi:MAG: hypothetical protein HQM07_04595 [Zetaproteobacteria bacterium]|nr:hypothetical protein [Zetaproteobacteria bacterium]
MNANAKVIDACYRACWIVEFSIAPTHAYFLQSLLLAEDGLATIRQQGNDPSIQQLWSTLSQRDALAIWLDDLPASLGLKVVKNYIWEEPTHG